MAGANPRVPPEVEEEILINLPVKSLNRFRCVSTSWQSLISEHRFVRKHLIMNLRNNLSQQKMLILINSWASSDDENFWFFPLSSLPINGGGGGGGGGYLRCPFVGGDHWQLMASYDGLLCVWIDGSVYIWNPCLNNAYRKVTPTFNDGNSMTTELYDLGYDSTMDDYKLFLLSSGKDTVEIEIYSLKSESWRKIVHSPRHYYDPVKIVFLNGTFHWLAHDLSNSSAKRFSIFTFDLSEHDKCSELPLPECVTLIRMYDLVDITLCVLKGMLCVLLESKTRLVLWAMKDYYSDQKSWTTILDIASRHDVHRMFGRRHKSIRPFDLYENGEILMAVVSPRVTELLICRGNEVLFREIVFTKPFMIRFGLLHVQSLVSPLRQ